MINLLIGHSPFSNSLKGPIQRENLGIIVQYKVKVKLCLGLSPLGGDVVAELPFTLMHPKPDDHDANHANFNSTLQRNNHLNSLPPLNNHNSTNNGIIENNHNSKLNSKSHLANDDDAPNDTDNNNLIQLDDG